MDAEKHIPCGNCDGELWLEVGAVGCLWLMPCEECEGAGVISPDFQDVPASRDAGRHQE